MNVRKRVALTSVGIALTGGLAIAPSATASASAPQQGQQAQQGSVNAQAAPRNCPKTYLCVYDRPNYKGHMKKVRYNNRNLAKYGGAFNHPKSAFNNGRSCNVVVYTKKNYKGKHYKLNRNTGWKYIGSNLPRIHSNKWVNCR